MRRLPVRFFFLWGLLFVLGALPLAAQAIELDQTITMDASTIRVPEAWAVAPDTVVGGWIAAQGELTIHILEPVVVSQWMTVTTGTTAADVIDDLEEVFNLGASRADIMYYSGLRYLAASYIYRKGADSGALIAAQVGDEAFLALHVQSKGRAVEKAFDLVNAIVASYVPDGTAASSAGMTGIGEAETISDSQPTGEACLVVAATDATLRVGPGLHRASIAYLNTTQEVTVTGRLVADDGGVWYQLDKSQAAPTTAANEIWVAAEDVETSGDCDMVGEVTAPPVIRAANPPAQPQPTSAPAVEPGSSSQGASSPAPQPTAAPAQPEQPAANGMVIPQAGTWLLAMNANTDVSCQGTNNVVVASSELWQVLSWTGYLSARPDGSALNIDGDLFTFAPPNYYVGSLTLDTGGNIQLWLNIQSPTFITGWTTINEVVDETPCSATTGLSITRQ